MSASLVEIRDDDFEPNALREHAESCDLFAIGFQAEADRIRHGDPEQRLIIASLIEDAHRCAAVFRGLADRTEADTARLNWLARESGDETVIHAIGGVFFVCDFAPGLPVLGAGDSLRAAIDDAIRAKPVSERPEGETA